MWGIDWVEEAEEGGERCLLIFAADNVVGEGIYIILLIYVRIYIMKQKGIDS